MLEWLNGRKTIIGACILFASAFLDQVLVGAWGVTGDWVAPMGKTLDWFGMVVAGTGLTHKGVKVISGTGATTGTT